MLILEKKISFFKRYNTILKEIIKPEIIYLDDKLIWKRFRINFGLSHIKLNNYNQTIPQILTDLSNDEIYRAILKSCGELVKDIR